MKQNARWVIGTVITGLILALTAKGVELAWPQISVVSGFFGKYPVHAGNADPADPYAKDFGSDDRGCCSSKK